MIGYLKPGDPIRYNYFEGSYTGTVRDARPHSFNRDHFMIFTEKHVIDCDYLGNGIRYNDYQTALVKCEDTPETRAALDTLKSVLPEQSETFKGIAATVARPAAE